jgi:hypothetical protein
MATPADQRLLELLDKWLKSLQLHTKYAALDDDSYWKIQPWVEHQRPNRWILDVAIQKTTALRAQVEERIKKGDGQFADSLELMIFLANLVGSEHIERFIPVADPETERVLDLEPPDGARAPPTTVTGTREMPKFSSAKRPAPAAATTQVARSERKTPATPRQPRSPGKQTTKDALQVIPGSSPVAPPAAAQAALEQVIADAVRLVQWGRKWFELPELIARMADRPPLSEVRRILKENKSFIDMKVLER